ncbi:amidohydrolase family protein [Desulfoferrobacter suflitae]|uniref:amidohydrolase family protein n=1 Tax=Desulfoferrobacter suflitae TaxID=2865782 RepID=UPI00216448F1|nr:amidohydrolase family protein [Desulfoferrobacter suflitae]MCK8603392.1 amidohydrolase family protein [Desulfoferrobacter suflitae]
MHPPIIDAHAHCGRMDQYPPQDLQDYLQYAGGSGIQGAVMFPPVMEIYNRYDPHFEDDPQWSARRRAANEYLVHLATGQRQKFKVYPFFFIWNDFAVEQLAAEHRGIKWHRHSDEPRYRYDAPRCAAAIEEIRNRRMPVCLEEEWPNTLRFIDQLAPDVRVIIPHCGLLNGGYERFCNAGVWERPNIFADTALAPSHVIADYVRRYGVDRIMFGSDFPFGDPKSELHKILRLDLTEPQKRAILSDNIERLMADSNR